jgi:hypothetical protein
MSDSPSLGLVPSDKMYSFSGRHDFRVSLRPVETVSAVANVEGGGQSRTRRAHKKSRSGCEACRKRHRKVSIFSNVFLVETDNRQCDELKPKCSFCAKANVECDYHNSKNVKTLPWDAPIRMSILPTDIWPSHYQPTIQDADGQTIQHTKHDLFLIHHFTQFACQLFASKHIGDFYTGPILSLAKEYPYVMHAMLALSGCHLQHLGIDASRYRPAEAFHSHFASRGLREAVVSMDGPKDGDSVLTTAMVLGTVAFCAADYRGDIRPPLEESGRSDESWHWLRTQVGLTYLLGRTQSYRDESIWTPVFDHIDGTEAEDEPVSDLGQRLKDFCGLDENSSEATSPYFGLADWLSPFVSREPSFKYLWPYIRSIGAMSLQFVDLLERSDTKALMLFVHWLGLMCSIDQWWCTRRTQTECWSICNTLSQRLDADSLKLLEAPAKACGYPLEGKGSRIEEVDVS